MEAPRARRWQIIGNGPSPHSGQHPWCRVQRMGSSRRIDAAARCALCNVAVEIVNLRICGRLLVTFDEARHPFRTRRHQPSASSRPRLHTAIVGLTDQAPIRVDPAGPSTRLPAPCATGEGATFPTNAQGPPRQFPQSSSQYVRIRTSRLESPGESRPGFRPSMYVRRIPAPRLGAQLLAYWRMPLPCPC